MITPVLRSLRDAAGAIKRRLLPSPEVAAWRQACRLAGRTPRFTPGRIRLMHYDLQYADLLTVCPQWQDLFVHDALHFVARGPAPRILDCGANVGLATLYFKRLYPQARITAFEADPALHALLAENLQRNGAADAQVVNAAIWTHAGSVDFRCEGGDSGAINSVAGVTRGEVQAVPSLRLRDLLAAEHIDLLKLDIEGAESAVLADCRDVLGSVDALLMDLHEFDPGRRSTAAVLDTLAAAGFTYSLDALTPLPWRPPVAPPHTPFAGRPLCWALLVRAWTNDARFG